MQGGKYLAEQRGAFEHEPEPAQMIQVEPTRQTATVPLYEAAAAHDRAPADDWLRMFYEWWGWLD